MTMTLFGFFPRGSTHFLHKIANGASCPMLPLTRHLSVARSSTELCLLRNVWSQLTASVVPDSKMKDKFVVVSGKQSGNNIIFIHRAWKPQSCFSDTDTAVISVTERSTRKWIILSPSQLACWPKVGNTGDEAKQWAAPICLCVLNEAWVLRKNKVIM